MRAFVRGHFTPVRFVRIHMLAPAEAFAGCDVVADELDDLEDLVIAGRLSRVPKDVIRTAIDGIESEVGIAR